MGLIVEGKHRGPHFFKQDGSMAVLPGGSEISGGTAEAMDI